ncbi:hypothetical protein [Streptomyces sp. NPDC058291]|uniref:hypothetical protein n=1 Tax=Streptomyces sp. NPDC058291 TaxID=3346427 RepID=UPI0036E646FE
MHEPQQPHEPQEHQRPQSPAGTPSRGRSPRARALVAATTVAVLALGGTVAYAATSNGSGGGSPSATPSASSSEGPGGRHGPGGPWFGLGGDAAHGETTVKDPGTGDWVVRVWQRGAVEKADDGHATVKSEDGASWTWTVGPDTRVSADGASGSGAGALTKGDTVFVVGTRSGDTYTADRVLSGAFGDRGRDDHRGGGPGHGPWDRGGEHRSPGPSGSGAAT